MRASRNCSRGGTGSRSRRKRRKEVVRKEAVIEEEVRREEVTEDGARREGVTVFCGQQ